MRNISPSIKSNGTNKTPLMNSLNSVNNIDFLLIKLIFMLQCIIWSIKADPVWK